MSAIPANVLNTLTCDNCKYYLNIPPLMSFKDGRTICGRCYDREKYENVPSNEKPTQNVPLESVIHLFPFPCIYRDNGCSMKNTSDNYLKHEAVCSFRVFVCPIEICTWEGSMINLKDHFEIMHRDNFSTVSKIKINTSVDCINYYLIHNECQTILFQSKFDASNNKYYCDCVSILHLQYRGERTYIMELKFEDYHNDPPSTLSFKKHLSNSVKPIEIGEKIALRIDLQALKSILNTNSNELEAEIKVYSIDDEIHQCNDSNLLNELKCPVCLNLFIPRIFLCSNGHSICEACKNQLLENTCPVCKVPYVNTIHNITLEKLIKVMIYPCKYHISGCRFVAPSTQIGEHEYRCAYSM